MVSARPATPGDVDRLVEIHFRAFPDPRGEEARRRRFLANPLGALSDAWVLEDGGVVVAHAFALPLRVGFGGRAVAATGIASLGVAPEARGRGLATALVERLHRVAADRGDAISLLYPFRDGFYARLGYGKVRPYRRLRVAPSSVPPAWRGGDAVRAATAGDRRAIEDAYARSVDRRAGAIVRPRAAWAERFADPTLAFLVATRGEDVVGYLSFELVQSEPHADVTARVDDLVADDPRAHRALWGRLGALRDQVKVVEIDVAEDDELPFVLVDPDRHTAGGDVVEHAIGVVAAGPMVRLVDAARALTARGYGASGAVGIDVPGADPVTLVVDGGAARVEAGASQDAVVLADAATLASIAYGGLSATSAERLGLVRATSPRALEIADRVFALPPYLSRDPF